MTCAVKCPSWGGGIELSSQYDCMLDEGHEGRHRNQFRTTWLGDLEKKIMLTGEASRMDRWRTIVATMRVEPREDHVKAPESDVEPSEAPDLHPDLPDES